MSSPQRHSRAKTVNSGTPAKTPQHEQASNAPFAPFAGLFEAMNAQATKLTTNPHEIAQQSRTQSLASAVTAVSYKSVLDVPGNWSIGAVNTESLSLGKDGALIIDNVSGVITMNKELDINGDFLVFAPQQIRLETGVSGRAAIVIQDPAFPLWDTSPTSTTIPPGYAGLFAAAINGSDVGYAAVAVGKEGNVALAALDTSGVNGAITIQGLKIVLAGSIPSLLADVKVNGAALLRPAYSEFFANDGDNAAAITPGDAIAFRRSLLSARSSGLARCSIASSASCCPRLACMM
jgi:hypothetical protein